MQKNDFVKSLCTERVKVADMMPWFVLAFFLALIGFIPILGRKEEQAQIKPPKEIDRQPKKDREPKLRKVEAIDVDGSFEIDLTEESHVDLASDSSTLMAVVENQRLLTPSEVNVIFIPSGFEDSAIIVVDSGLNKETALRFFDLERAIIAARAMLSKSPKGVQIKIKPGIYKCSIEVPPNIVIVNTKMPNFSNSRDGLLWVSQQELDDIDRVTILADPNKSHAVKFMSGSRQGIFGCHIVGRRTPNQCGIFIERSDSVEIVNCVVEQFTSSGIRIERAGSEFPKIRVEVLGSMIRQNQALQGGGIFVRESTVLIQSSVLKENSARQGGGVYIDGAKRPFVLDAVRFEKNVALDPQKNPAQPDRVLETWEQQTGLGGAIFGLQTKIKAKDLECIENLAEVAGGAISLLSSGMTIIEDNYASRIERNKSHLGAGVFVVGTPEKDALLKAEQTSISSNICRGFGGAFCILGTAIAQLEDCVVEKNQAVNASGGAISCHLGGSVDVRGGSVSENVAALNGGGIAASNGRIRIRGLAKINNNTAHACGGGIFAISEPTKITETLLNTNALQLPLKIIIGEIQIRYNRCEKVGAGLRLGNLTQNPTMPVDIIIDANASIRSNETMKGEASDLFATWAGQTLSDSIKDYRKKLLK